MAVFLYKGIDSSGKETSGVIEASTKSEAFLLLKRKGIYPTELSEESRKEKKKSFSFLRRGIRAEEFIVFFRTLSNLLDAGIPLVEAVDSFASDEENKRLKVFFKKVVNNLKEGSSFSEALKSAGLKDPVVLSLIASGEKSALLPKNLLVIANILEKKESTKAKFIQALIYPAVLLVVSFGVVIFMIVSVVPKVEAIYKTAKVSLPLSTKFLLFLSSFLQNYYPYLLLVLTIIIIIFLFLLRKYRQIYDKTLLKLPLIGDIILFSELSRFFLTFGDLLSAGIQVVDAYSTATDTVTNEYLKTSLKSKLDFIKRGISISEVFSELPFIPKIAIQVLRAGENSGSLAKMNLRISKYLEEEANRKLKILTSLLEPVTMLIVGLIVGFIVYALLLPILSISTLRPV